MGATYERSVLTIASRYAKNNESWRIGYIDKFNSTHNLQDASKNSLITFLQKSSLEGRIDMNTHYKGFFNLLMKSRKTTGTDYGGLIYAL
jgi:hypothetical protein